MGAYNIISPGSLAAGQPEDVSVILSNFQAIQAILNGGIDNANINAAAAILASKLAGFPNDATKALFGDGSWGYPGLVKLYDSVDAGVALPAASIVTPALPQGFKHLRVRVEGQSNGAGANVALQMRINNDATGAYSFGGLQGGIGTAPSNLGNINQTQLDLGFIPAAGLAGNSIAGYDVSILNYAVNGGLLKVVNSFGGGPSGVGIYLSRITSANWLSNVPVTVLSFFPSAGSFIAGSRITVYGEV